MVELQIPAEIPDDIVAAAEKVSNWFKQYGICRWSIYGCSDSSHYEALKVQSKLVVDCLNNDQARHAYNPYLVQRANELDNLLR